MPKERRRRAAVHEQSARISKRQFAVQDNDVEHIDVGTAPNASGSALLQSMDESKAPSVALKKKEKQQLKRELFLQRLGSGSDAHSKSHARRLKRKAKEQIAGGLGDIGSVLAAMEDEIPVAVQMTIAESEEAPSDYPPATSKAQAKASARQGLIGEGKSAPLTQAQRKRALQTEQARMPNILKIPEFASNPFQAIRTHAQNTLIKHQAAA